MNKRVLKRILIVFLMLVFRQSWSEEVVDLPEVVVQESRLDSVLDGTLFEPIVGGVNFGGRHVSEYDMMNDQTYHAFLNSLSRAASVCGAKISSNSKAVTSESDVVFRWLAAQEVLSWVISQNIMRSIIQARNGASVMIGKDRHILFNVRYSDGAQEEWITTLDHVTSSVKLLDMPVQGSLRRHWTDSVYACRGKG